MADEVVVGIGADLSDIAKALATLPAMTGAEAEKAVAAMTAAFAKAEKAVKAQTAAQKAAAKEAAEAQRAAYKEVAEAARAAAEAEKAAAREAAEAEKAASREAAEAAREAARISAEASKAAAEAEKAAAKEAAAAEKAASEAAAEAAKKAAADEKAAAEAAAAAQKKATDYANRHTIALQKFGAKAGDADTALKALSGAVGMVSPAAGSALSSLGDLAGGAEGAAKASALLGIAGTAAVVGVVAVAASVAAFAAAAAGAVGAALDLHEGWEDIQGLGGLPSFKLESDQIESIADGEAALTAAKLAAESVVVAFASFVAPAVENLAKGVTFLVLGTKKLVGAFGDAGQVAVDLATLYKAYVLTAFDLVAKGASLVIDGLAGIARFTGNDELANTMNGAAKAMRAFSGELKADAYADASEVLGRMGAAAQGVYDETVALTGVSKAHNKTVRDGADNAKDAAEEEKRLAKERADAAAVAKALEKAIGKITSASEALRLEEAETIAALVEHKATEAQIAEAREAYADRRVALTAETTAKVLELEQGASDALLSAVESYSSGRLTAQEKLEKDLAAAQANIIANGQKAQDELDRIAESARAGGDLEAVQAAEDAKVQVAKDTQRALTAASEEGARQRTDLATEEARAQSEVLANAVSDTIGDIGAAFSAYSDLLGEKYKETSDALITAQEEGDAAQAALLAEKQKRQKKGLIALFAAEQAAALGQIAIDTALGFSAVTAAYAATPPLMAALQALVITSGIAQAAAVSAARPSFSTGGVVPQAYAQQGETMIRAHAGEVVLNRQAVDRLGGPAAADRLNFASGGMGGTLVIEQRVGHRVFGETVYDDLRRPDSVLGKAIRGRARVGHRSR